MVEIGSNSLQSLSRTFQTVYVTSPDPPTQRLLRNITSADFIALLGIANCGDESEFRSGVPPAFSGAEDSAGTGNRVAVTCKTY